MCLVAMLHCGLRWRSLFYAFAIQSNAPRDTRMQLHFLYAACCDAPNDDDNDDNFPIYFTHEPPIICGRVVFMDDSGPWNGVYVVEVCGITCIAVNNLRP